jgi:hypothetical protein
VKTNPKLPTAQVNRFPAVHVSLTAVVLLALSGTLFAGQAAVLSRAVAANSNPAAQAHSSGRIEIAAEIDSVAASGPDQSAKPPAKPDPADPKVAARQTACKAQWSTVDSNGNGIVDGDEVAHYNTAVRAESQPVLADTDRLTEADFLAACSSLAAHE